jgi:hypothetical protein
MDEIPMGQKEGREKGREEGLTNGWIIYTYSVL